MASLMHAESRRLYSWWWDSHNSPKNSKWLQENLTDMDAKVKAMIKLIEEDADSFARRAEMYYKKRPELMKLVEEFYRAYRALAERYNHATGELRQAHRTMAQAFPDQVPFSLADDTGSGSEPDTPETPHPVRSFFDLEGISASSSQETGRTRKGLKQLNDMIRSAEGGGKDKHLDGDIFQLTKENQKLKSQVSSETERAGKAETELQTSKDALAKLEVEREAILMQLQQSLNKLSAMEKKFEYAEKESKSFDQLAREAQSEVQAMKEAIKSLQAERDTTLLQCRGSEERLAAVEGLLAEAQDNMKGMNQRAIKAESESSKLEQELAQLKAEKEAGDLLYKQCLDQIATLEKKLAIAEEYLKKLTEQSEKANDEANTLKEEMSKMHAEKDVAARQYEECLETIADLRQQLGKTQAENTRLNSEVLLSSTKLRSADEQYLLLGKINESLQLEAQNLAQKIADADKEVFRKQSELEKLMGSFEDERSRFLQLETTLHSLQNLYSRSQEEQKVLSLELRNGLEMMKALKISKQELAEEIQRLKDENQTLDDLNSSSSLLQKNLQDKMMRLKEIKEKLEAEVKRQEEQSDALQLQVNKLKEEIEDLYCRHQTLLQQMESLGLNPTSFGLAVKSLQDENMKLKESSMKDKIDREELLKKLKLMEELFEKNAILESSLSEVNFELRSSKEKAKTLQEFCHDLNEDKSNLVDEKRALLSQLQVITETMQNLLEKNSSLQTSLCGASAELEGLREKSKGLEEVCKILSTEKSNLMAERSNLVSRLEIVERKLETLERRFTTLEDQYAGLETEKQSTINEVEELRVSLNIEKQERESLLLTSEARLSGMEGLIKDLHEENKCRRKEFEEQLEKAVNAQVEIFILQKFIQDMEDKNYSLLMECQRHAEAFKFSEKLITELESENMIQEVEAEIMLDKIEMLREGINQVLKALEINPSGDDLDGDLLPWVAAKIKILKSSLLVSKDENEQLLIEKSIFSTILTELHSECSDLSSKKAAVEQDYLVLAQELVMLEGETHELLERSRQLNLEVGEREKREQALKAEVEILNAGQAHLRGSVTALEEQNMTTSESNRLLLEELTNVKKEKNMLEEDNRAILHEALAFSYQSMVLKCFGIEKALESHMLMENINSLSKTYTDIQNDARQLEEKLLLSEAENSALQASIQKMEGSQIELGAANDHLRCQISDHKELLVQKVTELEDSKEKLRSSEAIKTEMCSTIQYLEKENEDLEVTRVILEKQVVRLSEHNKCQESEIFHLRDTNDNLESEVGKLHEEIEERKIKEIILASELLQKSSEFELWEAEASSFYFDLHISSVREALLEDKFHELGYLCGDLEHLSNRRSLEIEVMKARVESLEKEADELRSQLTTCVPLISSLKENISLIEQNPVLQSKLPVANKADERTYIGQTEESSSSLHIVEELQKMQSRMKCIEELLQCEKENFAKQEHENASIRLEAALRELGDLKSKINIHLQNEHRYSVRQSMSESSETKHGAEMKDIPLDQASGRSMHGTSQRGSTVSDEQMLELWEAAEQDDIRDPLISDLLEQGTDPSEDEIVYAQSISVDEATPESLFEKELGVDTLELSRTSESYRRESKKNALERLASDAQKLTSLQISIQDLKGKFEPPRRRRKAEDVENDTFRRQLEEMENSVVQSMDVNGELMKSLEETTLTSFRRGQRTTDGPGSMQLKRVSDQVQREAEKIGRLELEMQKIKYALLRNDEKKSKGRGGTSKSNPAIFLREFFYSRGRKNKKPKKPRFCGCLRPSSAKSRGNSNIDLVD